MKEGFRHAAVSDYLKADSTIYLNGWKMNKWEQNGDESSTNSQVMVKFPVHHVRQGRDGGRYSVLRGLSTMDVQLRLTGLCGCLNV